MMKTNTKTKNIQGGKTGAIKVWLHTFGCKLNFTETATISRSLKTSGMELISSPENADFAVINTCTVTENANKDCKKLIRKIYKQNQNIKTIVVGCYAQLKPEEIKQQPGVVAVLGAKEKFKVRNYILKFLSEENEYIHCSTIEDLDFNISYSIGERSRVFLKIQDGCDYKCSFCTIPKARGASRSPAPEVIIEHINNILKYNPKEIVLSGINLGDYKYNALKLPDLLQIIIAKFPEIPRLRLSSIEPNLFSDELIALIKETNKIVPHFHIPLQSGSDEILKKMRRRYLTKLYKERILKIIDAIPDANIGVDVIVGFPGETQADFEKTYNFLNSLPIGYLHVFPYSRRENTLAAEMNNQVPENIKKQRVKLLRQLSDLKKKKYIERFLGKELTAVFEGKAKNNIIYGYTENYIKVSISYKKELENSLQKVLLQELQDNLTVKAKIL